MQGTEEALYNAVGHTECMTGGSLSPLQSVFQAAVRIVFH